MTTRKVQVQKAAADANQREHERTAAFRAVFLGSPEGQRALGELLAATGVNRVSFNWESDRVTSFNEGRRSIGLYIQEVVNGSRIHIDTPSAGNPTGTGPGHKSGGSRRAGTSGLGAAPAGPTGTLPA